MLARLFMFGANAVLYLLLLVFVVHYGAKIARGGQPSRLEMLVILFLIFIVSCKAFNTAMVQTYDVQTGELIQVGPGVDIRLRGVANMTWLSDARMSVNSVAKTKHPLIGWGEIWTGVDYYGTVTFYVSNVDPAQCVTRVDPHESPVRLIELDCAGNIELLKTRQPISILEVPFEIPELLGPTNGKNVAVIDHNNIVFTQYTGWQEPVK